MDEPTPSSGVHLDALAKDMTIGSWTRPLDLWIALAAAGIMAGLCAYMTEEIARGAVSLFSAGGDLGFVLGWFFLVFGLLFGGITYVYGWIVVRLLARDPVARWAAVTVGSIVTIAFLSADDPFVNGVMVFVLLANITLVLLCLVGPGIAKGQARGQYADVPLPLALSLVFVRAQALFTGLIGLALLPAAKFDGSTGFWGAVLVAVAITVGAASQRILLRNQTAAKLIGVLLAVDAVVVLVADRSQVSFMSAGLSLTCLFLLLGHNGSREFLGFAPFSTDGQKPPGSGSQTPAGSTAFPAPAPDPGPAAGFMPHTMSDAPAVVLPLPLELVTAAGRVIAVDGRVVLGRAPSETDSAPGAALEAVEDPQRSLSRSHLLVSPQADGTVLVEDLGSTNGTWIAHADETSRKLAPHSATVVRPGTTIVLGGDVELTLRRPTVDRP